MSSEQSSKQAKQRSCALCRRHKTKCIPGPNGPLPCRRCLESNAECLPQPPPSRSLVDRVSHLERKQDKVLQRLKEARREIRILRGGASVSSGDDSHSSGGEEGGDLISPRDRKPSVRSLRGGNGSSGTGMMGTGLVDQKDMINYNPNTNMFNNMNGIGSSRTPLSMIPPQPITSSFRLDNQSAMNDGSPSYRTGHSTSTSIANTNNPGADVLDERAMQEDLTEVEAIRLGSRNSYNIGRDVGSSNNGGGSGSGGGGGGAGGGGGGGRENGGGSGKRAKRPRLDENQRDSQNNQAMEGISLDIFFKRCANKLPFVDPIEETDLRGLREQDSLFYWSMVAVGSREAEELSDIHNSARALSLQKARDTLFGHTPTLDDLRGLLVIWMWLSDARSPGHVVSIFHELEVQSSCAALTLEFEEWERQRRAGYGVGSFPQEKEMASLLRIYGYLLMVDRMTSTVTGRPEMIQRLRGDTGRNNITIISTILRIDAKRAQDVRLCCLAEIADMLARLRALYSTSIGIVSPDLLAQIPSHNQGLDAWYTKWTDQNSPLLKAYLRTEEDAIERESLLLTARFIYSASKLHINTFPLRGCKHASQLTEAHMACVKTAVASARSLCIYAIDNIIYTSNITQLQMAFAAIFLLRMVRMLPGEFDEMAILDEIRQLGSLLSQISGKYYSKRIFSMVQHLESQRARQGELGKISQPGVYGTSEALIQPPTPTGLADLMHAPVVLDPTIADPGWPTGFMLQDWDGLGSSAFWEWMGNQTARAGS